MWKGGVFGVFQNWECELIENGRIIGWDMYAAVVACPWFNLLVGLRGVHVPLWREDRSAVCANMKSKFGEVGEGGSWVVWIEV